MNISFWNISAIYWDWLHSLGTRSADEFLKVSSTSLVSNFQWIFSSLEHVMKTRYNQALLLKVLSLSTHADCHHILQKIYPVTPLIKVSKTPKPLSGWSMSLIIPMSMEYYIYTGYCWVMVFVVSWKGDIKTWLPSRGKRGQWKYWLKVKERAI